MHQIAVKMAKEQLQNEGVERVLERESSPHNSYYTRSMLQKSYFVGLLESTFLRAGIPIEIRLPTFESPQTPRKWDPHWEVVAVLFLSRSMLQKIEQFSTNFPNTCKSSHHIAREVA